MADVEHILTTVVTGNGEVSPNCGAGCPFAPGEQVEVNATSLRGPWPDVFDEWEATGITLERHQKKVTPLVFAMPDNDVGVTAVFVPGPFVAS